MSAGLKYTLGRIGLFVACAVPALALLRDRWNPFLILMVALVVSAGLSWVLLRHWRDEVAEKLSESSRKRTEQKVRLRSALAGDDEPTKS